jgi:hypothetical protein
MRGNIFNNELLEEVVDIVQIPKSIIKEMRVEDIIYNIHTLIIPIDDISELNDCEIESNEKSREVLNLLEEQIERSKNKTE